MRPGEATFDIEELLKEFFQLRKVDPGKRPMILGAAQAALSDKSRTKDEKAQVIADLFHVSKSEILPLLT